MENIKLDLEQMKHLKELGCDDSNASVITIFTESNCKVLEREEVHKRSDVDADNCANTYVWFDECRNKWDDAYDESYLETDCNCDYISDGFPIFTLEDILEILPPLIDGKYSLIFDLGNYLFEYKYCDEILFQASSNTILDAAYKTLCWTLENKYI